MKNIKIRLAGYINDSLVNGEGSRDVIFVQGCKCKCKGCFNPETWDFNGGEEWNLEDLLNKINNNILIDGITLSGGNPLDQTYPVSILCKKYKEMNPDKTIWLYTGYTMEEIYEFSKEDKNYKDIFKNVDVIVDGRFIECQKNSALRFKGSENQRIIDLKETIKNKKIILY